MLPLAKEGKTSRWLALKARGDVAGLTGVRFQYRGTKVREWSDIPGSMLTDERGAPLTNGELPLSGGVSPTVLLDVPQAVDDLGGTTDSATLMESSAALDDIPPPPPPRPGPFQLRAVFVGGPGGISKGVGAVLDETGVELPHASAAIGPGSVDLLTGSFSYSTSDVTIDSFAQTLGIGRTYTSRKSAGAGAFGPGWTSSLVVPEANSDYRSISEVSEEWEDEETGELIQYSWVEVAALNGLVIYFDLIDGSYVPEEGFERLALSKPAADRFELRDIDGNATEFTKGTEGVYRPTAIRQPGSANQTTQTIGLGPNGQPRTTRVLAPVPAGVNCNSGLVAGCRALDFAYAGSTTATGTTPGTWGDFKDRLVELRLTAWDPATSQMKIDTVARYQYDNLGRLRSVSDPRITPVLSETYDYDGSGRLTKITPPGVAGFELAYAPLSQDPDNGRLGSVSRQTPQGTATTTVAYKVPVSGANAPYQMNAAEVERWAQGDDPRNFVTDATAIFPPGQTPASPPTSYSAATVHYLNRDGREVNTVAPGGHTVTTEYDDKDNVVRELSAANRTRALASANPAQEARQLDTRRTFSADGLELLQELGPRHQVRLASGELVQARRKTTTVYDEGAPSNLSPKPHLPTTSTVAAEVSGQPDQDARVTKTEYDWTLRKPTATIVDPAGLNLKTVTVYDSATGLVSESRMPRTPAGGDGARPRPPTTRPPYSPASRAAENRTGRTCPARPVPRPRRAGRCRRFRPRLRLQPAQPADQRS